MDDLGLVLAPVAACAATGDCASLATTLDAALEAGCAPPDLREILLLLTPFGGFPRTLDALGVFRDALEARGLSLEAAAADRLDSTERCSRGRALFERVYGDAATTLFDKLLELDPELPHWVLEDAYGRVMSRPRLAAAHRERVAVVFLAAMALRNQLSGHVRGALRCGASAAEVEASLAAAEPYVAGAEIAAARSALARAQVARPADSASA